MSKIFVTQSSMPPFEEYTEMIKTLWETHFLTNMGVLHNKLENKLLEYLKVNNLSLLVNGHMALEMALTAMKLPKGGEVITTPFTFISTTHAIVRNGLKPVFCDIKLNDFTIDEKKIEGLITEQTVAIVPVHVYGQICEVEKIQDIAKKYNLKVIYDACHAFGVEYHGEGIGIWGDASIFSFHATKVFHTVEGGAVAFNEGSLYNVLRDLKNFGIRSEEVVSEVGANAKMNEFSAAMGLCNLKYIDEEIAKRKIVIERYRELLGNVKGIRFLSERDGVKSNYAYFPIVIDEKVFGKTRNEVYNHLREQNIYSRKYFYPLTSDQACFRNKYCDVSLENARYIADRVLVLPLYADLSLKDVDNIVSLILEIASRIIEEKVNTDF